MVGVRRVHVGELIKREVVLGPPPTPNRREYPYVGTATFQGIDVLIETKRGEVRKGADWAITFLHHYGEVPGTVGLDNDPIDVYLGPYADAPTAYVVHQKHPRTQALDEDKVMLGFPSQAKAERAYRTQYDKGGFYAGITAWPVEELRAWFKDPKNHGRRLDRPKRVRILLGRTEGGRYVLRKAIVKGHQRRTKTGAVSSVKTHQRVVKPGHVKEGASFHTPHYVGNVHVGKDHGDGHVSVHFGEPGGHGTRVPKQSVPHLVHDLRGSLSHHTPTSGHAHVDAAIKGGKFLGKGNDGLAFKTGDHVVKASTTVPYQPANRGHRTPEQAVKHLDKEHAAHVAHAADPMVPKTESIHHEGRSWLVKPHLKPAGKLSKAEADSVRDSIHGMHERGWTLNDQIQLGRDNEGKLKHMDMGSAEDHGGLPSKSARETDTDAVRRLYDDHGHKYLPSGAELERQESKLREHLTNAAEKSTHGLHGHPVYHRKIAKWEELHQERMSEMFTSDDDDWLDQMDAHETAGKHLKKKLDDLGPWKRLRKAVGLRILLRKAQLSLFGGGDHVVAVKGHQRRSKTGRVSSVRPHIAKRKAAQKHPTGFQGDPFAGVIDFASGSNHAGEIRGMKHVKQAIGVAAPDINAQAERELLAVAGTGVPVFVDSGAFSEIVFNFPDSKGKLPKPALGIGIHTVKPIPPEEWDRRLSLYDRLGAALGSQLYAVAPDKVADQPETLRRLGLYADRVRSIHKTGANVIVPIQKGDTPMGQFDRQVEGVLGFNDYIRGIPMKKDATTLDELRQFMRDRSPHRVHLLGLGQANRKADHILRTLRHEFPTAVFTMDSNKIVAKAGRSGGPGAEGSGPEDKRRPLTVASDDVIDELSEHTWGSHEFMDPGGAHQGTDYTDAIGEPAWWLSQTERKRVAARAGLGAQDAKAFVADPDGFLQEPQSNEQPWYQHQGIEAELDAAWARYHTKQTVPEKKREAVERVFKPSLRTHEINIKRMKRPPEPKPGQDDECFTCGRPLERTPKTPLVECVGGGTTAVHADDRQHIDRDDSGYMGVFPVGSVCARKIPAPYRFVELPLRKAEQMGFGFALANVAGHQRRVASGKVTTVKAHQAKRKKGHQGLWPRFHGRSAPKPGEKGYRAPREEHPDAWNGREPGEVAKTIVEMALHHMDDPEFQRMLQTPPTGDEWEDDDTQAGIPDLIGLPGKNQHGHDASAQARTDFALWAYGIAQRVRGYTAWGDHEGLGGPGLGGDTPLHDLGIDWADRYPRGEETLPRWVAEAIIEDGLHGDRKLRLCSVSRAEANAFIAAHHKELPDPNTRVMFAVGIRAGGRLVAVATAGHPGGPWKYAPADAHLPKEERRKLPQRNVLELHRVASDGTMRNAASMLTSRMLRLAPESRRGSDDDPWLFVTYQLVSEKGSSYKALKGQGLRPVVRTSGKKTAGGARGTGHERLGHIDKIRWEAGPAAGPADWSLLDEDKQTTLA